MGYGGVFKSVAKIAVTYVGFTLGGPFGAAVASAAFTGATGGSFKEALISGATSYIGAQISGAVSEGITGAGTEALGQVGSAGLIDPISGTQTIADLVSEGAFQAAGVGALGQAAAESLAPASTLLGEGATEAVQGVSKFAGDIFDPLKNATSNAFEVFNIVDDKLLGDLLPNFVAQTGPTSIADVIGTGVGGLASLTLEQALNADIPGLDDALINEAGFNAAGVQALRNEARNALSQETFERLQAETANPGLLEDEFNKILASGIESRNIGLGPDVTEAQFREAFATPELGNIILGEEETARRQGFQQDIGQAFPGDAFQSIDDSIIDSIVAERRGPAEQQISSFEARGNLNPLGGKTAAQEIESQVPTARERIGEIGEGVLSGSRSAIGDIRDRATQTAGEFKLGDELFDVTPFSEERAGVISTRTEALPTDLRTAIGSEPIFDVSGALRTAGRAQGLVSGAPKQSFLDAIAAREGSPSRRTSRGLGSRGSGVF